jgi:hypothetical protein
MPAAPDFTYNGYGMALSGILGTDVIPAQASCGIPSLGGFASNRTQDFRHTDVVSFDAAFGDASGRVLDDAWVSALRFRIEKCNIYDVVTADRIQLFLHSRYSTDPAARTRTALGSRLENLRIAGYPVQFELDTSLYISSHSRGIPGSFASNIKINGPDFRVEKNSIVVPQFGTVRIADVNVTSEGVSATMLAVEFDSERLRGHIAIASGSLNGQPRISTEKAAVKKSPIEYEEGEEEEVSLKMDEEELEIVLIELRGWAGTHPNPKAPFLFFMGKTLTPEQFLNEVESNSRIGVTFLNILVEQGESAGLRPHKFVARAREANGPR